MLNYLSNFETVQCLTIVSIGVIGGMFILRNWTLKSNEINYEREKEQRIAQRSYELEALRIKNSRPTEVTTITG